MTQLGAFVGQECVLRRSDVGELYSRLGTGPHAIKRPVKQASIPVVLL